MSLIIRVVAIRHSGKKSLKQLQSLVHISPHNVTRQITHHTVHLMTVTRHIRGNQAFHQTDTHLFVWNIKHIRVKFQIRTLYRKVTGLIKQRHIISRQLQRYVKITGRRFLATNF